MAWKDRYEPATSFSAEGPKSFAMSGLSFAMSRHDRPLDFILDMADQFGDLVHFESRQDPMIFVNHPELAREVLISRPHAFVRADAVCDALRIFDGDSILVTEGDLWRQQRRLLQEGFRAGTAACLHS